MSRQEIYDPWPSIYWKCSDSVFQFHSEGYKWVNSELWKEEKEFNFEREVTMRKLFTSH